MRNIPTWECGDGITRADIGNLGPQIIKATSYTIPEIIKVAIFSNSGAAGAVTFTLPRPVAGRIFTFVKSTVGQNLILQATNGAKINNGTANQKYQNTTSEAGVCTIFADGTNWFVLGEKGTWANAA